MRRAGGVLLALGLALGLTACGDPAPGSTQQDTGGLGRARAWTIQTPDGREVVCVSWKSGHAGGLDCDWEGSR